MNDRFGSTARDFAAGIVTREGVDWLQCIRQSDEGRMT